ncbi:MAG: 4-hydroxy-3-methylbut-2-enyl diphosphate reductase [Phycisphaerae bacterium]|jgi:4-hydroxy-3-methylbut-2-enyl diphosphate reductase
MEVHIAEKCGFCNGVRNAISLAEKTLAEKDNVYSLGPIIHNNDVVNRLAGKGLITDANIDTLSEGTVIIRSHGVVKGKIEQLKERGLDVVDATCILVKRVQDTAQRLEAEGYKVVILGDPNHPEVISIAGHIDSPVIIETEADISEKLPREKFAVICQTTQSYAFFSKMVAALIADGFKEMKVLNTLCREALKRQESAVELAGHVDVMFILGGKHSSNTQKLAELCGKYNEKVYHLQNKSELEEYMTLGCSIAGISAGASTPDWVIEEFAELLREL